MYSSPNSLTESINELQVDILAEKLSNNPYLKYHILLEKNKKLGTSSQTIIGAINELLRKIQSSTDTNRTSLAELYKVIGQVSTRPELLRRVLKHSPSLIELTLSLLDRVNAADATRVVSFKDIFLVGETPRTVFSLSHIPNEGTITMNINGIRYYNGFRIDEENMVLLWTFTEEAGGFDITESEVIIEYTYDAMREQEASEDG